MVKVCIYVNVPCLGQPDVYQGVLYVEDGINRESCLVFNILYKVYYVVNIQLNYHPQLLPLCLLSY